MSKLIKNSNSKRIGASPGTLMHIGNKYKEQVEIRLVEYNKEKSECRSLKSIEESFLSKKNDNIKWLSIEGLHEVDIIDRVGKEFNLHPLLLEDILNTGQRAKIDDYDDYIFIVLKMLNFDEEKSEVKTSQISLVLTQNYVISFQEFEGGIFDNILTRIQSSKGNIRKMGADYLLYALMDAIVDSYFIILEKLGDTIDDVEDELMNEPRKEVLQSIHNMKREMLFLRNSIWPLREVVSVLVRCENSVFSENTVVYLRDVYDHIIQVIDTIEVYRDMLSGMLDTYLSSISNKTNDVMKVLTILSTIFIPITFIAGVYGMNFKYMPELEWQWGYGLFWIIAIVVTLLMFRYFKKKKWL